MRNCPTCGKKIGVKLFCYSSGSGCLTLTWREDTRQAQTVSKRVTRKQAERFLASKEGEHLVNWLPVEINGQWVLAGHVKRIAPNMLRMKGDTYRYTWNKADMGGEPCSVTVKVEFRMRVKGKAEWFELKNHSYLMQIYYFLKHEEQLKPQFKGFTQVKED